MNTKQLSSKFHKRLENVMNYNNQYVVIKYSQTHNVAMDKAERHFIQLKKFLLLCSLSQESYSPSAVLDDIWHTFILFTKDYKAFCEQYLGQFIHHVPHVYIDGQKPKKASNNYAKTLTFALEHFNVDAKDEDELWPIPKVVNALCDGGGGPDSKCSTCHDDKGETGSNGNCKSTGSSTGGNCSNTEMVFVNQSKATLQTAGDCETGRCGNGGDCSSRCGRCDSQ